MLWRYIHDVAVQVMILVIALEYGARTIHAKRKIRDWKWKLCPRINVLAEHRAFIVIHPKRVSAT